MCVNSLSKVVIRQHIGWELNLQPLYHKSNIQTITLPGHTSSKHYVWTTAATSASEGEAVLRSPTNMAVTKIAAVDFIDLY